MPVRYDRWYLPERPGLGAPPNFLVTAYGPGSPRLIMLGGCSNFEYWARHSDVSKIQDEAMEGIKALESVRVLAACGSLQFGKIVDVGGGKGTLIADLRI